MENKHYIAQLPDYLDDTLPPEQKEVIATHIASCTTCKEALKELQILSTAFDNEPEVAPSARLRDNFFAQLEAEKQSSSKLIAMDGSSFSKKTNWPTTFLKIAASIALLIGSYFLGKQQQAQIAHTEIALLTNENESFKQTAMLSLMGNKSASKRIQGVQFVTEFSAPDETIVSALIERMLNDENTNVRRTAVEVLSEFTRSELVTNGFIKALKTEKDPGIQITIIQILGKIQERNAVVPMQNLLERKDTQPYVKEELELVLPKII